MVAAVPSPSSVHERHPSWIPARVGRGVLSLDAEVAIEVLHDRLPEEHRSHPCAISGVMSRGKALITAASKFACWSSERVFPFSTGCSFLFASGSSVLRVCHSREKPFVKAPFCYGKYKLKYKELLFGIHHL